MKKSVGKSPPDFDEFLKVIRREKSDRAVLFEFLIDTAHLRSYSDLNSGEEGSEQFFNFLIDAYKNLGYDYTPIPAWLTETLHFPMAEHTSGLSRSQNEGGLIEDEASFHNYPWPDPAHGNYEIYEKLNQELPDGMKLLACSHGGLLENVTDIVGFERLCMMYLLEPELTAEIFDAVGYRLCSYYSIISKFDSVGACIINDDWGFRNQTMFPPEMMKQYVYPWTRKMVGVIKSAGKPVIFHSCGNLREIMEDIINDLGMDAKHSYEDAIYPVEKAYEWWHDDIAILGGIDVDFLCQKNPEVIRARSLELLEMTYNSGGYALGSGNSIAHYVPRESFLAMIEAFNKFNRNLN